MCRVRFSVKQLLLAGILVCMGVCLLPWQSAQATKAEAVSALERLLGDWYDNDGHRVLTIRSGYINDCEVMDISERAGGGGLGLGSATFSIRESNGIRNIRIGFDVSRPAKNTDSLTLVGGDGIVLHRSPVDYFYETVDGIHLGLSKKEVRQLWGEPVINKGGEHDWYYPKKGVRIRFNYGSVDNISMLKGSKLRFGRSGLGAGNSLQEYAQAYGNGFNSAQRRIDTGYGEQIWLDDEGVNLNRAVF